MRRPYAVSRVVTGLAIALAPLTAGCGDSGEDKPPARTISAAEAAAAGQVASAERRAQATPDNAEALADLARAHVSLAYARGKATDNAIGPRGAAELRKADDAWYRYLALDLRKADGQLATLMARAYNPAGLDEPEKAARALEIAAQNIRPRNPNLYAQIAIARYRAHQFSAGDTAARRAIALSPPNQRGNLRTTLRQIRSQATTQG